MSFFSSLGSLGSGFKALVEEAKTVAAKLSLDTLQQAHGVDVRAENLASLDLPYLPPRLICARLYGRLQHPQVLQFLKN